jgi:hypothetical protein
LSVVSGTVAIGWKNYYNTFYATHRHATPAVGSSFTALFTATTVVFFFPLRDVIRRHITAAG